MVSAWSTALLLLFLIFFFFSTFSAVYAVGLFIFCLYIHSLSISGYRRISGEGLSKRWGTPWTDHYSITGLKHKDRQTDHSCSHSHLRACMSCHVRKHTQTKGEHYTQKDYPARRFNPRTFLLWDNNADNYKRKNIWYMEPNKSVMKI